MKKQNKIGKFSDLFSKSCLVEGKTKAITAFSRIHVSDKYQLISLHSSKVSEYVN